MDGWKFLKIVKVTLFFLPPFCDHGIAGALGNCQNRIQNSLMRKLFPAEQFTVQQRVCILGCKNWSVSSTRGPLRSEVHWSMWEPLKWTTCQILTVEEASDKATEELDRCSCFDNSCCPTYLCGGLRELSNSAVTASSASLGCVLC